jgi:hypothetical protein
MKAKHVILCSLIACLLIAIPLLTIITFPKIISVEEALNTNIVNENTTKLPQNSSNLFDVDEAICNEEIRRNSIKNYDELQDLLLEGITNNLKISSENRQLN